MVFEFNLGLHPTQLIVYNDPHKHKVVDAGKGWGKALALDTPILTSQGWSTIGELNQGDFVFDEEGKPVKVTYTSEIYHGRSCYEVTFSDNSKIVADASHDWVVEDRLYRKQIGRGAAREKRKMTTEELSKSVDYLLADGKPGHNYAIPISKPVQLKTRTQIIDPYLMGAWLGDGHSNAGSITTADEEILQAIRDLGYTYENRGNCGKANTYAIFIGENWGGKRNKWKRATLRKLLCKYNLIKNKHIPEDYLYGDIAQRLALIQGMMDTDGTISSYDHCEFSIVNKKLAWQFYLLICSMGVKATFSESDAKLYGRVVSKKYRIKFTTNLPVFRLKKKLNRMKGKHNSAIQRRFITKITPIESVPVQCIAVDTPSHLFLAGHCLIATHNTDFVTKSGAGIAMTKDNSCGAIIAPFAKQANYDYKLVRKLITERRIEKSSERWMELTLKNGAEVGMFSAENPEAARGYAWDWVIVDEAAFCDPEIFPIIDSQVGKRSGIEWDVSTPNGKNYFYDLYCREETDPKNYKSFHFTTYDNPYYPIEEIERMRLNMDEITFRQEILAEFIEGGLVFPHLAEIMTAVPRDPIPGHQYVAGIDLAKVNDFTVIKIADSADNYEVHHARLPHSDWSVIKSTIYATLKRYNNAAGLIDLTGVGSAVVEDLQKMTKAFDGAPEQGHLLLIPTAFTQKLKPELIRNYIMAQGNHTVHLINDQVVKKEHEQMMAIKSEAMQGYVKYQAPKGRHDDTVMAAALMCWGLDRYAGNQLAGPFTDNELNPLIKKQIDPSMQIDVDALILKSESKQIAGFGTEEDQNICSNYE